MDTNVKLSGAHCMTSDYTRTLHLYLFLKGKINLTPISFHLALSYFTRKQSCVRRLWEILNAGLILRAAIDGL